MKNRHSMKSMREFLLTAGLAALAYFSPLYEMFIVLMLFVLADLVTGIVASRKRGIPRSSRRLRKSTAKLVNYIMAMILAFAAERAFGVEWFVAHRAIGAFICAVEMLSILENMAVITEHPVFMAIVRWFRGKASAKDAMLKELIDEKNNLFDTRRNGDRGGDSGRMHGSSGGVGIDRPAAGGHGTDSGSPA